MKVADGFEPGAVIGPLIDMKAVERVEAHIAEAVKKGANVVRGGKPVTQGCSPFVPVVPELFRQIVARPNRYGRATTCRLSATFLP